MFSLHSIVWAGRLYVAEKLRALAEVIHEDVTYRMPGLNMIMVRGVGVKVIEGGSRQTPGCPLFYRSEDYDKAFTPEGDYYDFDG